MLHCALFMHICMKWMTLIVAMLRNKKISNDVYVNTRLLSWHPSALIEKNRGDGIDLVQIWIYNLNWQRTTDSSITRTNILVIIMMMIIIMVIIIASAHTHTHRTEKKERHGEGERECARETQRERERKRGKNHQSIILHVRARVHLTMKSFRIGRCCCESVNGFNVCMR